MSARLTWTRSSSGSSLAIFQREPESVRSMEVVVPSSSSINPRSARTVSSSRNSTGTSVKVFLTFRSPVTST